MKATYFHKSLHSSLYHTLYRKRLTKIFKILESLMSAFHVLISNKSLIFYLLLFRVTVLESFNYIGKYEKTKFFNFPLSLVQQSFYQKQDFVAWNIPKEMPLVDPLLVKFDTKSLKPFKSNFLFTCILK